MIDRNIITTEILHKYLLCLKLQIIASICNDLGGETVRTGPEKNRLEDGLGGERGWGGGEAVTAARHPRLHLSLPRHLPSHPMDHQVWEALCLSKFLPVPVPVPVNLRRNIWIHQPDNWIQISSGATAAQFVMRGSQRLRNRGSSSYNVLPMYCQKILQCIVNVTAKI